MTRHLPIMANGIMDVLIRPFESATQPALHVDCTLGGGGHVAAMLERLRGTPLGREHRILAVDRDESAIAAARQRFSAEVGQGRLILTHAKFSDLRGPLPSVSQPLPVLGVLADLGFSSDQIDSPERGLSFRLEGPLDMRLDPSVGMTARQMLMTLSEREIADLIWNLGEERMSRKIARRIVEARSRGQLPDSTLGFADLVSQAFPPAQRHGKIHAATRTFQALRIAVNDEMGELDGLLNDVLPSILSPGGRVAVISFHSLEDRRVKRSFLDQWTPLTKKPIEAGEAELAQNPRSRSAKVRFAELSVGGRHE